eukprot:TRINITY_DN1499_c0_g1_i2.p1 TRINITY_DN1499_c0_g1~~TRINITY_DN1499_c0_g1_i2.p1  ORF type:complete len:275 (-),score=37.15 TRINITY_DN1499_c0_g1_i2:315-1139(-)
MEYLGYIAAGVAAFCFGSFNLPLKYTKGEEPDAMVYQLYMNVAIVLQSLLFIIVYGFPFSQFDILLGVISAALWMASSLMAIIAVQRAGLAIAQGMWSASTITVSFLWGVLVFDTVPVSLPLSIVALGVLGVGIVGFSISGSQLLVSKEESQDLAPLASDSEDHYKGEVEHIQPDKGSKKLIIGIIVAACLGVTNGSMLAPGKFAPPGLVFIIVFGIGLAVVTPFYSVLYFGQHYFRKSKLPSFDPRVCIHALLSPFVLSAHSLVIVSALPLQA